MLCLIGSYEQLIRRPWTELVKACRRPMTIYGNVVLNQRCAAYDLLNSYWVTSCHV